MNEEEICPSCLLDEVRALDNEVIELDKLVSVHGYLLVMFGIATMYLLFE